MDLNHSIGVCCSLFLIAIKKKHQRYHNNCMNVLWLSLTVMTTLHHKRVFLVIVPSYLSNCLPLNFQNDNNNNGNDGNSLSESKLVLVLRSFHYYISKWKTLHLFYQSKTKVKSSIHQIIAILCFLSNGNEKKNYLICYYVNGSSENYFNVKSNKCLHFKCE